jgi:hypothetical protein
MSCGLRPGNEECTTNSSSGRGGPRRSRATLATDIARFVELRPIGSSRSRAGFSVILSTIRAWMPVVDTWCNL